MRPDRFELPTPGLGNRCSIQLSYGRFFLHELYWYFVVLAKIFFRSNNLKVIMHMKAAERFTFFYQSAAQRLLQDALQQTVAARFQLSLNLRAWYLPPAAKCA